MKCGKVQPFLIQERAINGPLVFQIGAVVVLEPVVRCQPCSPILIALQPSTVPPDSGVVPANPLPVDSWGGLVFLRGSPRCIPTGERARQMHAPVSDEVDVALIVGGARFVPDEIMVERGDLPWLRPWLL
jgi:hypothetical protein